MYKPMNCKFVVAWEQIYLASLSFHIEKYWALEIVNIVLSSFPCVSFITQSDLTKIQMTMMLINEHLQEVLNATNLFQLT